MNEGFWLKRGELGHFAKYKFKHTSKVKEVFVGRILEYLSGVGLLKLEKAEVVVMRRLIKSAKSSDESLVLYRHADDNQRSDGNSGSSMVII